MNETSSVSPKLGKDKVVLCLKQTGHQKSTQLTQFGIWVGNE